MTYTRHILTVCFIWLVSSCILTVSTHPLAARQTPPQHIPLEFTPPESCETPFFKVPLFKGNLDADDDHGMSLHGHSLFSSLQHGGGGSSEYADDTKWSVYPQYSENAHIIIGLLTLAQLYIWFCNVIGRFTLSKALIVGGGIQSLQGIYLLFFVFYVYAPHDLVALREYVMNDLVELQHIAISSSLLAVGLLDILLGILLTYNCFIFTCDVDRYGLSSDGASQRRHQRGATKNNLLFFSRYIHIIGFVAQALNGLQFITHPQHSPENDFGHFLLGMSLIIGSFTLLIMRLLHQSWSYFAHLINPSHHRIEAVLATSNPDHIQVNSRNEMVISGSKYNLTQLSDLQVLSGASPLPSPPSDATGGDAATNHQQQQQQHVVIPAVEMAKHHHTWDTSLVDCEFDMKKYEVSSSSSPDQSKLPRTSSHIDENSNRIILPHEEGRFDWNRQWFRYSRVINFVWNCVYYLYTKLYLARTRREIIVGLSFIVSSISYVSAAIILITFKEPPTQVHMSHYYKCFSQYGLVVFSLWCNFLLVFLTFIYTIGCVLHYYNIVKFPRLYQIKLFHQSKFPY